MAINRVVLQELTRTDGNVEFPAEPKIQGADRSGVDIRVRDGGRCRGLGGGRETVAAAATTANR